MKFANTLKLAAAGVLFAGVQSANALVLTLEDLTAGDPTIVVDDAVVDAINTAADDGVIAFNGAFGNFNINVVTGTGEPALEDAIDLAYVNISDAAGSIRMTLQQDGLQLTTTNPFQIVADMNFGGTTGGTTDVESFIEINNGGFLSIGTVSGAGGGFSANESLFATLLPTDTFNLKTVVTVTHTAKGQISSGDSFVGVTPIPVPAALPLFLTALLGLGFVGRRRRAAA